MNYPSDSLVSIGLPVRDGADRIVDVVESVLAQDHDRLELVICDNASTDQTEEICRELVAGDSRIVYYRHPANIGLLGNFISAIRLANGTYFRWIGDDDWVAENYVSRCLDAFACDERLMLVSTQISYVWPDGVVETDPAYDGMGLASADSVDRFIEMLSFLNRSRLLVDPLYSMVRREPVAAIPRRNMLREDEIFALKLALAGPWGHVPEILATRNISVEKIHNVAKRLGVPAWQAHFSSTLQCQEILRWIKSSDLTVAQQRRANVAVLDMYTRRQAGMFARRGRKLRSLAASVVHSNHPGALAK